LDCFECFRLDGAETAVAGEIDLDVSGIDADRIDVADFRREVVGARYRRERNLVAREPRAVVEDRIHRAVGADLDAIERARRIAVGVALNWKLVRDLRHTRHIESDGRAARDCEGHRGRARGSEAALAGGADVEGKCLVAPSCDPAA
jgi:hypothetical protein